MKSLFITIGLFLAILMQGIGQVPQLFSYQAVLRNTDGTVMANQAVNIKISLRKISVTGDIVYTENENATTTAQGLISLTVGDGNTVEFAKIPWSSNIFIQIEVKKTSETTYQMIGPSQILSVPYALAAGSVKEVKSDPNPGVDDPIFEVKNKDGKVVFGVYQGGVRIYVDDSQSKGSRGGFAIGGLTNQGKGLPVEYLRITPDSARIYIKDGTAKGARGGFAIGGLTNQGKSASKEYFKVTNDTSYFATTLYASSNIVSTGTVNTGAGTPSLALTDIDGNVYTTVKIGSQTWMKENLRVTKYSDGTPLSPSSEMAVYNQTTNADTLKNYGRLYSYSVIFSTQNVCPSGWHIPTTDDWNLLLESVGGVDWQNNRLITGLKLMEKGTISGSDGFWNINNSRASNISGFSGRPGGQGEVSASWGYFSGLGTLAYWWGKTGGSTGVYYSIDGNSGGLYNTEASNLGGYSVRCVKN